MSAFEPATRENGDDSFTEEHRKSLMKDVEAWFETVDAMGLSYAGLASLLRDLADDFG
jgi:hypothetical protein